jgi:hypothetical protein
MNKLLAGAIRFLNGFFAVLFVIVGAVAGATFPQGSPTHALIGAIVGFVVALLACGLLALFIEIRTELIRIREALEKK